MDGWVSGHEGKGEATGVVVGGESVERAVCQKGRGLKVG